jgi:hypothetical protein
VDDAVDLRAVEEKGMKAVCSTLVFKLEGNYFMPLVNPDTEIPVERHPSDKEDCGSENWEWERQTKGVRDTKDHK